MLETRNQLPNVIFVCNKNKLGWIYGKDVENRDVVWSCFHILFQEAYIFRKPLLYSEQLQYKTNMHKKT